ncbi:phosphohydrolase [bacterium (Candidatus Torokbacteria) CG09_land_8_20_14_0_10_42_11]|nr:MAG: phosphohydrolase [bacterium (Candidatus Torokbacteria) CG09_land_8_20_14_0_10_42_11]
MKNNLHKIFDFLHQAEKLKSTLRYNKTRSGRQESTADHSWRLGLMVFLVVGELKLDLNMERAMKIALVHDIGEALTGDIDAVKIAEGKFQKADKTKLELAAMHKLKNILPASSGVKIYSLWQEYEQGKTKEARFIKALDKLETLTQLVDVGYRTYDKPEFIANYADNAVAEFPALREMLNIIKQKLKKEFEKGDIPWKKEYGQFVS